MTIDEAIAHEREVAEEQRKDNENCKYKSEYGCKGCADYYSKPCIECAEEHEQLAEWLEELKDYRDKNKMVVRIDCANSDEFKDMVVKLAKEQYNKAIDDFSTDIINKINFEHKWLFDCKSNNADTDIAFSALITFINELAEQLKAGGENENYNKEES